MEPEKLPMLITKKHLWDQWRYLKHALAETEAMLKGLGESFDNESVSLTDHDNPHTSSGRVKRGLLTDMTMSACKALKESFTVGQVVQYIEVFFKIRVSPNSISVTLGKFASSGILTSRPPEEGSKSIIYSVVNIPETDAAKEAFRIMESMTVSSPHHPIDASTHRRSH